MRFSVPKPTNPLSSALLLAYGFAALIVLGAILLMMPFSSSSGAFTSPLDALFTATSAVCVTGLVVLDTAAYWSTFGQVVILLLFQVGGIGFVTGATLLLLALGRRFGLKEKLFVTESIGTERLEGVLGVVTRVAVFSLLIEAIGTVIFYFNWLAAGNPDASWWTAVFHSVAALTNSGFHIFTTSPIVSPLSGATPLPCWQPPC